MNSQDIISYTLGNPLNPGQYLEKINLHQLARQGINFKQGEIGLKTENDINLHTNGSNYIENIKIENSVTFSLTGLNKYTIHTDMPINKMYGYNKKFLNDQGKLKEDFNLNEMIRTVHLDKNYTSTDFSVTLSRLELDDCQIGLIYNMLCTWFCKYITERSGDGVVSANNGVHMVDVTGGATARYPSIRVPCKLYGYSDSHCWVPARNSLHLEEDYVYVHKPPVLKIMDKLYIEPRTSKNYFSYGQFIKLPKIPLSGIRFILSHIGEQEGDKNLNFILPTKLKKDLNGFYTILVMCEPSMMSEVCKVTSLLVDNYISESETLFKWILSYCEINRLNMEFITCLDLLLKLAMWPNASSMESCLWQQNLGYIVTMPLISINRAMFPIMLEGDAYYENYEMSISQNYTYHSIECAIVANMFFNYCYLFGTHMCHTMEAVRHMYEFKTFSEQLELLRRSHTSNLIETAVYMCTGIKDIPICFRALAISTTFGEIVNGYNLTVYFRSERKDPKLTSPVETVKREITINPMSNAISGCLLDGILHHAEHIYNHYSAVMTLRGGMDLPGERLEPEEILAMSQIQRYLNNNLIWTYSDVAPESTVRNTTWSPAHEWLVDTGSVLKDSWLRTMYIMGLCGRGGITELQKRERLGQSILATGVSVTKIRPTWSLAYPRSRVVCGLSLYTKQQKAIPCIPILEDIRGISRKLDSVSIPLDVATTSRIESLVTARIRDEQGFQEGEQNVGNSSGGQGGMSGTVDTGINPDTNLPTMKTEE
uniref:Capsid protein n=1 Tax=Daqing Totiv tick virus 1 TaxID=2972356 RepID=A0A9E7V2L0_9VIRU|nr:MAG: capsid protein [Daqing Totiv tick virus 1]